MDFELSDEQRLLKDSVERLFATRYDFESRKKYLAEPKGWSEALWRQYAGHEWLIGCAFFFAKHPLPNFMER